MRNYQNITHEEIYAEKYLYHDNSIINEELNATSIYTILKKEQIKGKYRMANTLFSKTKVSS